MQWQDETTSPAARLSLADLRLDASGIALPTGRRVLLLPGPGEQHTFGLSMVAEFFRRSGWEVVGGTGPESLDPVRAVRDEWFDVVGISVGVVFFGANTYIGNAPNFMVKAMCEESKIKMPSFFGYMLYTILILVPVLGLIHLIFLR